MNTRRFALLALLAISLFAAVGCGTAANTVKVGVVFPLTGDEGDSYGVALKRVAEFAADEVNEKWQSRDMALELIFADGKCTSEGALEAATDLVENEGVRIIFGGVCSAETLGIAPFAEENRVLLLSPTSGSTEITNAGDFVFRTIYSNTATVETLIRFIEGEGYSRVALLTEDTRYAQDLRSIFLRDLGGAGASISADEVVEQNADDVADVVQRAVASNPDAVIILPQVPQVAGRFAEALTDAGFNGQAIGNDIVALDEVLEGYTDHVEGYVVSTANFEAQGTEAFATFQEETNCYVGQYCATVYDGLIVLSEQIEDCGATPECLRDALYSTRNWEGTYYGDITFDGNGDIGGAAQLNRISDGERVAIR